MRRVVWMGFAVLLLVTSCSLDDQTDSETHWQRALFACDQDSDCRDGLSCLCGMCTRQCASEEQACSQISGSAVCAESTDAIEAFCGPDAPPPASFCANDCIDDTGCPDEQSCTGGYCKPAPITPAPDAGPDVDSGDGTSDGGIACADRGISCDTINLGNTVILEPEQPDGTPYCGPLTFTSRDGSFFGDQGEATYACDCVDGELKATSGPVDSSETCGYSPPWGRSIAIDISAPGYQTVETSVETPCECHPPKEMLSFQFEAAQ